MGQCVSPCFGLILGQGWFLVRLQTLKHLEWWRLCFFLSTLAPICWVTSLAVKLLVTAVESQLFIAKNALYFMAAVKVLYAAISNAFQHAIQKSVCMCPPHVLAAPMGDTFHQNSLT